jgi:GNAT superfamily N-acetyltransferase
VNQKRTTTPPPAEPAAGALAALDIHPVTQDRWDDLKTLFKTSPVMSSCWCMSPRIRSSEFSRFGEESRRRNEDGMHGLIASGAIPGLIAYVDGRPAAWVAVAPREQYVRLRRSRAEGDDRPVWSIVCFYTRREYRRQGMTRALIQAAVQHAAAHGAAAVEAYPLAGWGDKVGTSDAYGGMASTFRELGFYEVGTSGQNRGQPRLTMRYDVEEP